METILYKLHTIKNTKYKSRQEFNIDTRYRKGAHHNHHTGKLENPFKPNKIVEK